ncbi:hypothetical protein K432DRAFT_394687 [Lepidopterella palustris CBS 459.81]|uniref:Uncharacterized protein n=1 Tax=Lepidopterella palustris CBS 459.81 TaxID=1314670 RepID=A0A8E2JE00_9PEZI|nr:hypothetical protein K432DRAFT_394687 [Lepidopterella palustris CBS 459.81]
MLFPQFTVPSVPHAPLMTIRLPPFQRMPNRALRHLFLETSFHILRNPPFGPLLVDEATHEWNLRRLKNKEGVEGEKENQLPVRTGRSEFRDVSPDGHGTPLDEGSVSTKTEICGVGALRKLETRGGVQSMMEDETP